MDSLSLWLALAPSQVEELRSRRRVPADITFSRIDLSSSQAPVGRPSDVHQCYEYSQDLETGNYCVGVLSKDGSWHLGEGESRRVSMVWYYTP